jgi:hypothetical protein
MFEFLRGLVRSETYAYRRRSGPGRRAAQMNVSSKSQALGARRHCLRSWTAAPVDYPAYAWMVGESGFAASGFGLVQPSV